MALDGGSGGGGATAGAIRAGAAFVTLGMKDNLSGDLKRMQQRFAAAGTALAATGGLVSAAAAAVLAPIVGSLKGVVDRYDHINDLADQLGATTEDISALGYAADLGGSSLDDFSASAAKLNVNLGEAEVAGSEAAKKFAALGLNAQELADMPLMERMKAIADVLAGLSDPAKRAAAAQDLLGKSGRAMIPFLKDGAAGLERMRQEAALVGDLVPTGAAQNAARIADVFDRVKKAVVNTFQAIGAALLPSVDTIEQFQDKVLGVLRDVRQWLADNRELILTVLAVAGVVAAAGTAVVGLGMAFSAVSAVIGGVAAGFAAAGAVLAALLDPIALVAAGVAALGYLFFDQTETGKAWAAALGDYFGGVLGVVTQTWDGIKAALGAGDLKLAFDIAVAGLNVGWQTALGWLDVGWKDFLVLFQEAWNAAAGFFTDTWFDAVAAFKTGVFKLADGSLWAEFVVASAVAVNKVGGFFTQLWTKVKDQAGAVFGKIAELARSNPLELGKKLAEWAIPVAVPIVPLLAGAKGVADELAKAGEALGNDIGEKGLEGIRKEAEEAKKAARAGGDDALAEARQNAENARQMADDAVAEAKARLAELVDRAKGVGEDAGGGGDWGDVRPDLHAGLSRLAASAGTFSTFGFGRQIFGDRTAGVENLAKDQLKEQKKANDLAAQVVERLDALLDKAGPVVLT